MNGTVPTYNAMHYRIRRDLGTARNWCCAHCDRQAVDWAYNHGDPNEIASGDGPYSLIFSHYLPLCRSCHTAFDVPRSEHCPRCGSEYHIRPDGWRKCQPCSYRNRIAKGEIKRPGIGLAGDRTHCPHGHEYTPENTHVARTKRGGLNRMCRECGRQRCRARRAAARERSAA